MKWVHGYIGNWGWAIVVLTLLINIALFPLRHKSVVSMRKMQEIQPQMKAIQDRYAKYKVTDPERQKMNTEVMELYKTKGVNPASGCLPTLLTFPFLFGFYNMLGQSIEIRGADFAGWIHNLSAPDPYYILPVRVRRHPGLPDEDHAKCRRPGAAEGDDVHADHVHRDVAGLSERPGGVLAGQHGADHPPAAADDVSHWRSGPCCGKMGRAPAIAGLGLAAAGVHCDDHGAVVVDVYSRSNVPSVHAVGDVTNRVNLTPVAIREGQAFADTVFGGHPVAVGHALVPTAVFTTPELGTVGLSEAAALAMHPRVDIYRTEFRPLKATLSGHPHRTFMKLVVDGDSGRVLGAHMLGHEAGEMAQLLGVALRMNAHKADLDATLAVHPTAAEEWVTLRTPSVRHGLPA